MTNAGWNGSLPNGAVTTVGFLANVTGANAVPAGFTLNGKPCVLR